MKKSRRIEIRVSDSFYDMLSKVCEELECSKTEYLIERALSVDFVKVHREPWEDDFERKLGSISNNLNQMARALNEMKKKLKEHEYLDPVYFANFLNDLSFDIQEIKVQHDKILEEMTEKEKELFIYEDTRELLEPVMEYLKEEDEDYLKKLTKRENEI